MTVSELLPLPPEQIEAEIELSEMPVADAYVAVRAVEAFAPVVRQKLKIPEKEVVEVQEDTVALARGIIRRHRPAGGEKSTEKPKIIEPLDPNVAIDRHNQRLIDEYNNDVSASETLTVEAGEVAFMALCLKLQKDLAEDPIKAKEAEFALEWLEENPETQPIVEQVVESDLARI